jgi:hypothetical protein
MFGENSTRLQTSDSLRVIALVLLTTEMGSDQEARLSVRRQAGTGSRLAARLREDGLQGRRSLANIKP